jgi:colanic acid biosynthesis glycosyl transferase WcaI
MLDGEGARVIEQAGAGLTCNAGGGAALAQRVRELMAMSAPERAAMGERGRRFCEEEFERGRLITMLEGWLVEARGDAHASTRLKRAG